MTLIARACRVALVMLVAVIVLQTSGALSASELEPTNVRVTPGDGILGVTWEPPAEQDMTVVKYVVNYTIPRLNVPTPSGKFCGWNYAGATWTDVASTQTSYTITGLQNGQEYCVRVGARFARTSGYSSQTFATPSSGEQPLLVSANVVGATLRLTFDELLDANSVPPASVFTVVVGGSAVAVSGVNIQGTEVTLTLSSAASASDAVTLSYAIPTGATAQPLQDWLGNQAPALSNQVVVNTGTASSDATLSALTVSGATLTPAFSSATEQYRAVVPYSVTAATVTPTPGDSGATVAFSPSVDADTNASGHQVPLGAGQNTLDIVVTAENTIDRETYTLSLTRSLAPPEAPASNYLSSRNDSKLVIRWWPPARDGGSPVVGYKVQWTSDPNSWESSDQAIVTEMVPIGITSQWAYKITGLQNGTEYRMRVIAYNSLGDSEPTNEITGTPISLDSYFLSFIEDQVVAVYGNSSPWLRTSWEHMKRNGKVFNIVESAPGSAAVQASCSPRADGLHTCRVTGAVIQESIVDSGAAQLSSTLIHEMAHYYDKNSDLSGDISALSALRLYLESLPVVAGNNCRISELYADVFLLSILPDVDPAYWDACTDWNSRTTAEAVAVMRSAISGTMPAWFSTTYGAIADGPDLEKLWVDVKNMEDSHERGIVVYQLRDSFGGYCSNSKAAESAFEDGVARNPWRDGGCVPGAPGSVAANAAGSRKLAVSWSAPASDGGSPIEGYRIQWKSGSQQYDTSRQAVVVDVAERNAHTIAGLTNGTEHSVRIVPYNQNGDGASTEVTATPSATDTTPPELLRATVDSAALVLTWNEALDTASVPAAETFSVTVASNDRAVDDVVITGSAVELTLASPVVEGEVVSLGYTVPTAQGAAPIRDLSQNPAESFADFAVRNTSVPLSTDTGTKRIFFQSSPSASTVLAQRQGSGNYYSSNPVPWATTIVTMFVEPNDSNAVVTFSSPNPPVDDFHPDSGYCRGPNDDCRKYIFRPSVGENVITVTVTAEDGVTTDTFTVPLVRDVRPVTVEFAQAAYTASEGQTTSVTVRLDVDPEREITIPLTVTELGGASPLEYSLSRSVTFTSGGPLTQSATVTASTDGVTEQGERIVLGIGTLPHAVELGAVTTTTVTFQDQDSTPPALESASVSGSDIVLTYDKELDSESVPPTSAFDVSVAGATRSVATVSLSGKAVELQLSAAVAPSEPVVVSYAVPTGSGVSKIRDTSNNNAAGFMNRSVRNDAFGPVCNRTGMVRDAIVKRLNKNCSEITARELSMITGLEIARSASVGKSALKADDLSGLSGLRTLSMFWHRNLTTIPRNIFYGLSKLENLLLFSNKLTVLEAGVFSGLNSLQGLSLSNNRLSSLPDGIFSGLTSLERLNLSGNTVDPLPVDIGLEAAGSGTFKVTVHSGAPFRIELPIVVTNGQLSDGSSTVVIPAGSTESAPVAVARLADTTGAVTVDIGTLPSLPSSSHSGYSLVKSGSLPLEITTDAVVGTSEISIAPASSPVTEGEAAAFTLTRAGDTAAALTVDVSVSESGATVSGTAPATATFDAGSSTAELSVATEDDTVVEAASTITATVTAGTGYTLDASASSAEVAVNDNDAATFTVSASPAQIEEGETSTLTVAIAKGVTFAADQTIALDFAASTAAAADYALADGGGQALASPYALTLAAGASTVTATVTATDDAEQEPAETIEAAASHEGSAIGSASIEVAASDGLTARFENLPESHDGSSAFQFELHFSEEFRIGYQKLRDRAFEVSGGTVTRAQRLEKGSNIGWRITLEPDSEGDIAVTLPARACGERGAVCAGDGRTLSEAVSATVPGPAPPEISIAPASSPVTEGEAAAFTLSRTGDTAAELAVDVSVSETGATVAGTAPTTATFDADSSTAELSVTTEDDTVVEAASTITATVAAGTGYDVDADASSAEVAVNDNDAATFTVSASPAQIEEGESSTLTVAIANGVTFAADQTIALDFAASTAAAADYAVADGGGQALASPYALTLVAGADTVTATVTATDDSEQEPAETIEVAASLDGMSIGSVTIQVAASDGLTARFESVPESHDGSTAFSFELHFSEEFRIGHTKLRDRALNANGGTVTRARRLESGANIGWEITIEPDSDGDIVITLPVRACGESGAVCTDDSRTLSEVVSATVPGPGSGLPTISIAPASSPVTEGTAAAFALSRTGDVAVELTVDVSVSETGAMVSGTAPETATFDAGSATAELSVATKDDEVVEDTSTITAAVAAGADYSVDASASSAEVVVEDDDALPVVTTVSPVEVAENETAVVTLAATDDDTAIADLVWSIPQGATGGADASAFALSAAGELSLTAGKDFEAPDDADQDGAYEVTVQVSDGANETLADLTVQLADVDDIAPTVSDASIDGATLTLTFSEALDESAAPASNAFSVSVDGAARDVSSVAVSGSAVTLTLASAVVAGETVTVGYAAPTGANASPLRDVAGNEVADFSAQAVTNDTPANTAPEGLPTISGVAQVGETLTASASEVSDTDGLANAVFAWQWIANDGAADAEIADATGSTYMLTSAEAGKTIKVQLTFSDDSGTEETLVSAATTAVVAPPPEISIEATTSTVSEGRGAAFQLNRTGDAAATLTVQVSVNEVGAVLSGTPASTVTFATGSGTATLNVATEDDEAAEADGRVTASLVAGSGYTVDTDAASASVAVFDNDEAATTAAAETLWASTLTVIDFHGIIVGLYDGLGGALSPDGWTEDGEHFRVENLYFYPGSSELAYDLDAAPSESGQLTLHLDDLQLQLIDVESMDFFVWTIDDPGWEDGQTVAVKLTREDPNGAAATPPGISVADARVQEAEGATLSFAVTLDAAQPSTVSVRYATSDGTAQAGADYVAASGALRFEAGQTRKTVRVPVLNDTHDEGSETLTLTLSRPFGAQLSDAQATGTIVNTGPIPQAWLARFGRTAAEHVLEGVEERLTATREAGTQIAIAGQVIGSEASHGIGGVDPTTGGTEMGEALGVLLEGMASGSGDNTASGSLDEAYPWNDASSGGDDTLSRSMTGREVLAGTSLQFGSETSGGGLASLWGRGAYTSFSGQDGGMAIEGDVSTATLGADYAAGGWIAGLALSQSRGAGSWRDGDAGGAIESDVTGLYPYAAYGIGKRFSLWGTVGYGSGTLTVSPEGHEPLEAGLALRMAAAGARGALLSSEQGDGFDLAVKTDVLGVQTSSEEAEGSGGRLEATTADVTRLRLALEGSWEASLGTDSSLRPTFEVGLRHDGGDAETGFGLEFGGGLALTDPVLGLSAEIRGHGLLTHEESTFRDHGVSGSLRYDPQPYSDLGLSLIVSPSWGAGQRGIESMWETAPSAGAALGSFDNFGGADSPDGRLDAEIGYGLPALGGRATGTPWARVGLAEGAGDYRLGYRLNISGTELGIEYGQSEYDRDYWLGYGFGFVEGGRLAFHLGAELARRVSANDNDADDQAAIRATLHW